MLEERTRMYWELCRVWNGKDTATVSTEDAIEWCASISTQLRPEFSLKQNAKCLLDEIVAGGSIYMGETYENVLPFRLKQEGAQAK
jgi:hypothetical protein